MKKENFLEMIRKYQRLIEKAKEFVHVVKKVRECGNETFTFDYNHETLTYNYEVNVACHCHPEYQWMEYSYDLDEFLEWLNQQPDNDWD